MFDNIRGIVTGRNTTNGAEKYLYPNLANTEYTADRLELTPRGFRVVTTGGVLVTDNTKKYIYVAIRRPDPLVSKAPTAGTDVFAMDTGNGSSTIPSFDSNFVVDYALTKEPAADVEWYSTARLTGPGNLHTNTNGDENDNNNWTWDSQSGWGSSNGLQSNDQSWMWKRHAGFDVVTYKGNVTAGRRIPHNLGQTPQMIWVKYREGTEPWAVYHFGAGGGVEPEKYHAYVNTTAAFWGGSPSASGMWNSTPPDSKCFTVGTDGMVNDNGYDYVAMLFASVTGISKCGYFDADGAASQTITTGFQPRFLILKAANTTSGWYVLDTLRGWSSGNDQSLQLQEINAQASSAIGEPTATGFTVTGGFNNTGEKWVYYAHA
tara:strand:- start:28 stop:1155 length:1128 start_codon:yes stop_codon:yes gene_type:complete